MLKAINTTGGAITAGQTLPLTLKYNTNNNTALTNNTIVINKPGYYDITGSITVTATSANPISVTLNADGTAIPEAVATITPESGSTYTLVIPDIEKVIRQFANTNKVALSFIISADCTLVSANVSVVEIR